MGLIADIDQELDMNEIKIVLLLHRKGNSHCSAQVPETCVEAAIKVNLNARESATINSPNFFVSQSWSGACAGSLSRPLLHYLHFTTFYLFFPSHSAILQSRCLLD